MTRRSGLTRRSALLAPLLVSPFLAAAWRDAAAQDYPAGTIRIIAPGPAGSPRDMRARWAAEQLGLALDRTVIVDNKAGAGGNIGTEAAASSTVRKVSDLVALARATPGKLSYGSSGIGTPPHLAGELFIRAAGIDVLHVPYKGAPPAIQDLVGGRLDFIIESVALLQPLAAAGKVHSIAVSGPARLEDLSTVPTFAEQGLPGATYVVWIGLAVPTGTPAPLVERLNRALSDALATEKAKAWFRSQGTTVLGGTPADFVKRIDADYKRWGDVIRAAGIKAE
jgi:tripartite-type tricarboxylate transporter receptor subunit TctC